MARPRSITDERLVSAAATVIGRCGPGFTLAQVAGRRASRSARSPAVRLQERPAAGDETAGHAADGRPHAGVRRGRTTRSTACGPRRSVYAVLGDAEEAANHLGQLGVDIGDPVLRSLLGEHFAAVEDELGGSCARRRAAAAPSVPRAAGAVLGVINGVSIDWSIRPHGRLADRLAEDVDAVLSAWRGRGST